MHPRPLTSLILLAAACTSTPKPPNLAQLCSAPSAAPADVSSVEAGNATFAVGLFEALADAGGNLVMSPYSVSAALDLAYAGAATSTATQMAQVLGLGTAAANPGPAAASVGCQVETDGSDQGNQLSIANAIFGQQGTTFEAPFLSTLRTDYGAPLQTVDFTNASAAVSTIDAWVSTQTDAMIPTLLQPGDVDDQTRLVLVNALYFKGTWENGFDSSKTQQGSFQTGAGGQVTVPMMTQSSSASFGYYSGSEVSIAELPYQGDKIALDIVLPTNPDGLAALTSGLSASQLQGWFSQLGSTSLNPLSIPRFKIDTHVALAPELEALGLTLAFQPDQADFSGMDGQHDFFIQSVIHEAVIDVDESGTTAAAATAVSIGAADVVAAPPPSFVANHPFLFVLRDLGTGTLLFIGQVTDPSL